MDAKYPKKSGAAATSGTATSGKSLHISEALRNALCTNLCVTEDDLAKIISDSQVQEN